MERKVKYWVDSMNSAFHQDHPGKAPDGMDLVTIYEESVAEQGNLPDALKGLASVNLSPFKQQLIGLRTSIAEKKPVVRVIRTVGRYAGGADDFCEPDGDGEPATRRVSSKKPANRSARTRTRFCPVSAIAGTRKTNRRHTFRRLAANAGDWPGVDE